VFAQVRAALAQGRERFGFRLVHFSVQSDQLQLIVEARDGQALARGMQGLCIRVARASNAVIGRKGKLFADRYEARSLTTPREVRLALGSLLFNAKKHARAPEGSAGFVDPCSSAPWFDGFERAIELEFDARAVRAKWERQSDGDEPPVVAPRTLLLRSGWKRLGLLDGSE
jgi:hypothetical protein